MSRLKYLITALFLAMVVAIFLFFAPSQSKRKVTIVAAADLKFAMVEIVASFRKEHPGDQIEVIYGSSSKFDTQIRQGAPYDIFFSADVGFTRELKAAGQAITEPRLYAIGRIVLWSAKMATALVDRLTHHCHILETGNDSFRFRASTAAPKAKKEKTPT